MIKTYLRTSFRYLQTHKVFAIINLTGLTLALLVCLFAVLFIQFELSYDSFHSKSDRIYRLATDIKTATGIDNKGSSFPMAGEVKNTFPAVEASTHIVLDYYLIQKNRNDQNVNEVKVANADSTLFSVFDFPLIKGNFQTALNAPLTVVLSESLAKKYFGDEDPMNKSLLLDGKIQVSITGVMKDIPVNSHVQADMLLSMVTLEQWNPGMTSNWNGKFIFHTYVLLPEGYDPDLLSAKFPELIYKHMDQSRSKYSLLLEPLNSIYLHGKTRSSRSGSIQVGNAKQLYTVGLVSCFVLFIACFNFINLTTAFSLQRMKEVGVRKVIGASKSQLIFQFLSDAVMLSIIAFLFTLLLAGLTLPIFNQIVGKIIISNISDNLNYVGLLLGSAVFIGIICGIFPALFIVGFNPMASLKGPLTAVSSVGIFRKVLVVTQFSISIILIIATLVVYNQLNFMKSQSLGFSQHQKLVVDFHFDAKSAFRAKEELKDISGIQGISISSSVPGKSNHKLSTAIENIDNEMEEFQADSYFVDFDFIDQYNIKIIAGRAFSDLLASDSSQALILNESAVKALGFHNPADAIGVRFKQAGDEGLVVGIIEDFHFHSLKEKIEPLTLRPAQGWFTFMTFDITDKDINSAMPVLEKTWNNAMQEMPFNYFFLDQSYAEQYASDERFGKMFTIIASMAIFISCLGLLGLSAFSISRRTKEIGIRKVLGANVSGIVTLLTKEFIVLVAIAFIIAAPLAWLGMKQWLDGFAYRTTISLWVYFLAGIMAAFIAFITVSAIAVNAAIVNPVKSLRSE